MEASLNGPSGRISLPSTALSIGRAPDNQVVLADAQSSSHHAEVRPDAQGYAIVDLSSTNGTFVNEQRLAPQSPRLLMPGDVVRIGTTQFTYEVAGSYDATMRANAGDFASQPYQPTVATPPPSAWPSNYAAESQPGYQQPPSAYGDYGQGGQHGQYGQQSYPAQQPAAPYPPQSPDYQQAQPRYNTAPQNFPPPQGDYQQQWGAAPGQLGVPPAPVAPPRKRSRTGLIIGLVVLLLLLVGGGIGGYLYFTRSTPEKTLQAYCTALQNSDAQGIFNLESSNLQQHTTVNEIRTGLAVIDSPLGGGGVKNCAVGPVTNNNGTTATGTVTITLGNGKSQTSSGVLVNQNGSWKLGNTQSAP